MDPGGDERAGDRTDYVSAALVRDQVSRILRSPSFLQVPTLGRLLHYLVEHTVAGNRPVNSRMCPSDWKSSAAGQPSTQDGYDRQSARAPLAQAP